MEIIVKSVIRRFQGNSFMETARTCMISFNAECAGLMSIKFAMDLKLLLTSKSARKELPS